MDNGKEPTRAEVFIETHKHKDGILVDLEMAEKIDCIKCNNKEIILFNLLIN